MQFFILQIIMQLQIGWVVLIWYGCFDFFVVIMGSFEMMLFCEWYLEVVIYYDLCVVVELDSVFWKFEVCFVKMQFILMEMVMLYVRRVKEEVMVEDFVVEY